MFDFKLFTGSKDRTAKVWDLITGGELTSLTGHANNVSKIKYCPSMQLCFTVSGHVALAWDLRCAAGARCVRTLNSSGLSDAGDDGGSETNHHHRSLQNEMPFGEKLINDLAVAQDACTLYTASGSSVKFWDLRGGASSLQPIGKLSGGHSASITTMLVDGNLIVTGSKDHFIKIFEMSDSIRDESSSIHSKFTLTPPHYDGVQSLCRLDSSLTLFSCSRDMCIKKWDLGDLQCKQSLNNAHKDWICSLDHLGGDILLSGCRGGYLKFWHASSLEKIADFRAHLCPINSIKCSKNMVFTASDDATVRIWRRDK